MDVMPCRLLDSCLISSVIYEFINELIIASPVQFALCDLSKTIVNFYILFGKVLKALST